MALDTAARTGLSARFESRFEVAKLLEEALPASIENRRIWPLCVNKSRGSCSWKNAQHT